MAHSRLADPEESVRFIFHASPYGGQGHAHADQNSFHVIAYNEHLLLDSGWYTPTGDPHREEWYVRTMAHNTLLVDGTRLLTAVFEVLHRRRLAVPRQIAVIAIDAVEPLAAAMPETIGIARDFAEIGRRGAQLMIDRLSGALTGPPVTVMLPSWSPLAEAAAPNPPALQLVGRSRC